MVIQMDTLFRVRLTVDSKTHTAGNITSDPHEVKRWARYFQCKPKELLAVFSFYLLEVTRQHIYHSIETQTLFGVPMKELYPALAKNQQKKNKENLGRFWKDTEFLMNALQVWDDGRHLNLGIPRGIAHPTSDKVDAQDLFIWLELGTTRGIPPRPLILPILRFILKRKEGYWNYFLQLATTGKINIKKSLSG